MVLFSIEVLPGRPHLLTLTGFVSVLEIILLPSLRLLRERVVSLTSGLGSVLAVLSIKEQIFDTGQ